VFLVEHTIYWRGLFPNIEYIHPHTTGKGNMRLTRITDLKWVQYHTEGTGRFLVVSSRNRCKIPFNTLSREVLFTLSMSNFMFPLGEPS